VFKIEFENTGLVISLIPFFVDGNKTIPYYFRYSSF